MHINLNLSQYYETINILEGVFSPLDGFMKSVELDYVLTSMQLIGGEIFPIPILLDIPQATVNKIRGRDKIDLYYNNNKLCQLEIHETFKPNKEKIAKNCFGTTDIQHPGVFYLKNTSEYCVAGKLISDVPFPKRDNYFTPLQTKAFFKKRDWKTIAGFQTRNVPHKAHEYLHRLALEMVDGLMIQPLIGWKKTGDYTPEAIQTSYKIMINEFYPKDRVLFNLLYTPMRYAGPREALFHAIIRRNYGCTHFIVGRDHAGVKNYYGVYEAQQLALQYEQALGIKILAFKEPYYCKKCDAIVTEKHCGHAEDSRYRQCISGTMIRAMLENKQKIDNRYLRQEIFDAIEIDNVFI